jgi:hypothetical protein
LAWIPVRSLLEPLTKKSRRLRSHGELHGRPGQAGQAERYSSCSTQETGLSYGFLECHDTVNTIGAEDAELAFVITAEVDEAATTLASAG